MEKGKLFYRLQGYLTIRAEGYFLERFLNICMHRNFKIRNVRRLGEERLICDLPVSSFRRIRSVCRRTKTKVRIIKRRGVPFLLHRYRKRKVALVGIFLALALLWYTSGHIMGITVFGNEKIPTEDILRSLAQYGVEVGKPAGKIDAQTIRNHVMQELDALAWMGININGSRVYIQVVERITPEPRVAMEEPCHLVAKRDGVILSVEAKEGQTEIMVGSGVRKGDILVSGVVDNTTTGYRLVHAYGEVMAQTEYQAEREYPLEYVDHVDTGNRKKRYSLRLADKEIPLYLKGASPYPMFREEKEEKEYAFPWGRVPSLVVVNHEFFEQQQKEVTRTVEEILVLAEQELSEEIEETLHREVQILNRELTHTLTEYGTVEVTLTYTCTEDIAEEQIIALAEEKETE